MGIFTRFQAISDNQKSAVVRKLLESSTPDFDFFYLTGLAVLMATLGLLANNTAIVIGSMLIAPILYPIVGFALGLIMSDPAVRDRSFVTLLKAFGVSIALAAGATLLFGGGSQDLANVSYEILLRTEPTLISMMVAVVAGLAVSFSLAQPDWNETLPGIAVSVALIPPLAVTGIGIAWLNMEVISGAAVLLGVNVIGIVFASMVTFSLMNLYEKRHIASSTIKKEEERLEEERETIETIEEENKKEAEQQAADTPEKS